MKLVKAQVSELVPSQYGIYSSSLRRILGYNFNHKKFERIPVIEQDSRFILGGGHHRAFMMSLASSLYDKILQVPLVVAESDDEISRLFEGKFSKYSREDFLRLRSEFVSGNNFTYSFPAKIDDMQFDVQRARDLPCDLISRKALRKNNMIYCDEECVGMIPLLDELRKIA